MSRHTRLHLAFNLDQSIAAQCDCVEHEGNHTVGQVYRVCFECGATYLTEYILVQRHLNWFRDQENIEPRYRATITEQDHHGEFIYSCPECTHDW